MKIKVLRKMCKSPVFYFKGAKKIKKTAKGMLFYYRAIDENKRLFLEVEPSEDMRDIQYEIDPRMKVWKNSPNTDPAVDNQPLFQKRYISIEYRQKAEEDRDDIDHPVYVEVIPEEPRDSGEEDNEEREKVARYMAQLLGGAPYQPEANEDQISPVEKEALSNEAEERIYLHPEEDMDHLYHKEVLVPAFYQDNTKAVAPDHLPSQIKYSEPEVDLDHIYHK